MKYDKKDLMNEGWNAMESLLNEEMPTKTKDHNFMLIGLFVFVAFVGGYCLGISQLDDTQNATLENITTQEAMTIAPVMDQPENTFTNKTKESFKKVISKISDKISTKKTKSTSEAIVYNRENIQVASSINSTSNQNSTINLQEDQVSETLEIKEVNTEVTSFDKANILLPEQLLSQALAVSYLPRSNTRLKKQTNWVLGLGLSTGINPARDTKVASLKSEWMYKVGNDNAIGLEFIYAAEDKFGFLNFGDQPVAEIENPRGNKPPSREEEVAQLIQNSRQFRFAAGIVFQQEFGYRFYSNLGAGVNLLQNSFSNELAYKTINSIDDIRYQWGGYSSLAFGYRISKFIDFELSGTKSMYVKQGGEFQQGNTDQITGGLKISF